MGVTGPCPTDIPELLCLTWPLPLGALSGGGTLLMVFDA